MSPLSAGARLREAVESDALAYLSEPEWFSALS